MTIRPSQFEIHPSSGVPIYRQVIDQVRTFVLGGRIKAGEMLPSVRQMAAELEVNPMTISKAYAYLESEGVIQRIRGRGMMIQPLSQTSGDDERSRQLYSVMREAVLRGRQLGLSDRQILKIAREATKGETE